MVKVSAVSSAKRYGADEALHIVTCPQRRRLLFEVFTEAQPNGNASSLALLLKRLHESLSKLETFEVESASGALDGMFALCCVRYFRDLIRPCLRRFQTKLSRQSRSCSSDQACR